MAAEYELAGLAHRYRIERDNTRARLLDALAAIARVRELHSAVDSGYDLQCAGCKTHVTFTRWPCATIDALESDATAEQAVDWTEIVRQITEPAKRAGTARKPPPIRR
jgi:trans-aconitate methyltransferase